jgi:anti-sigma regulatory factor (Ser/Thr protein kinase)
MPHGQTDHDYTWRTLIEFDLPAAPGSERLAADRVSEAMQRLKWPAAHLGWLKLALVEAMRNAMERSRRQNSRAPIIIRVLISHSGRTTRETNQACGESTQLQASEREVPQSSESPSRGWGFFLIEKAMPSSDRRDVRHLIELFLYPEGEKHDSDGG